MLDAVFLSPHKFVGGVGASGVLIAKKGLFRRGVPPSVPGGGTVFFVTAEDHLYLKDIEVIILSLSLSLTRSTS